MDGISFEVKEGEFFAFPRENGTGKSMTIQILCTIREKMAGDMNIVGVMIANDENVANAVNWAVPC